MKNILNHNSNPNPKEKQKNKKYQKWGAKNLPIIPFLVNDEAERGGPPSIIAEVGRTHAVEMSCGQRYHVSHSMLSLGITKERIELATIGEEMN